MTYLLKIKWIKHKLHFPASSLTDTKKLQSSFDPCIVVVENDFFIIND